MSDNEQKLKDNWVDLVRLTRQREEKVEFIAKLVREIYQKIHLFKNVRDHMIEFMKDGLTDEEK